MDRPRVMRRLLGCTLLLACGEMADPVQVSLAPDPAYAPGGNRPTSTFVKLRRLTVEGPAFTLEGAAQPFTIQVDNANGDLADVRVEALIVQGSASRLAAAFAADCPPNGAGGLPQGSCTMTGEAAASNAAPGSGTLVVGNAQIVVNIVQDAGGSQEILATRKTGVTLLAPEPSDPTISDLRLASTLLVIGGPGVPYEIDLSNPSLDALNEVILHGEIVQGAVVRGAGGRNVVCPPDDQDAVLPPGTCTMEWTAAALATSGLDGAFEPGNASLVLTLTQGFVSPVVLDSRTVPVTLVRPAITDLQMQSTTLVIGGARVGYTVTLMNPADLPIDGMQFQSEIVQGTTVNAAGGFSVSCPLAGGGFSPPGELPPGMCTVSFTAGASNVTGTGTLQAGPAQFHLVLWRSAGTDRIEMDRVIVEVDLITGA